jgi:three-Cys-motif partner protein
MLLRNGIWPCRAYRYFSLQCRHDSPVLIWQSEFALVKIALPTAADQEYCLRLFFPMPRVSSRKFFTEQTAHSRVKADIVYKYVLAWGAIVLNEKFNAPGEAAYVDLFSGPGSYDDGARSTPLLITEQVLKIAQLRNGLRMFFNDINPSLTNSLKQEIKALPQIDALRHAPHFTSEPASITLIDSFDLRRDVPQFYFLDQFGWADIPPSLVRRIFLNRKCDCAFFFRTPRVIAAVTNPSSEVAMMSLFGESGLESLREEFKQRPREKETIILERLRATMKEAGAAYFQPFPFRVSDGNSSRQHLIYLGKHPKGLEVIKDIMAASSTMHHGGVPVMGFTEGPMQHGLFTPDPIPELQEELLRNFAGRTVTVGEVFEEHHVTSERYILRNYQEALRRLEASSCVRASPKAGERPKRSGILTCQKA